MNQHTFTKTAAILFSLVTLLHAARVLQSWPLVIGTFGIPMWWSMVAVIVIGFMAYSAWKLLK